MKITRYVDEIEIRFTENIRLSIWARVRSRPGWEWHSSDGACWLAVTVASPDHNRWWAFHAVLSLPYWNRSVIGSVPA
jgi:hypothetical protein